MKGNSYQTIFVVVLLNFNVLGVVSEIDESNEERQPNYEYIQIFKSIPALFEYLLDALEERPEILEKNDVTMFNRNIDGGEMAECDNSDSEKKMDKRDANCDNTKAQDEYGGSNKVNKRDTSSTKNVSETTVAYEYGNSNIAMKGLDDTENKKVISKRFANTDNFNNFAVKEGMKRELLKRENRINKKKTNALYKLDDDTNDMFQNYGEVFFGFEHLFGLDLKPEEIEERILTAEKLLEEHNSKTEKKRNKIRMS